LRPDGLVGNHRQRGVLDARDMLHDVVAGPADVRFWHKADMPVVSLNVRFRG
jgi:hypothetical protein